jgi:hypothetical protein
MTIAIRWREETLDCEFTTAGGQGILKIFADGELLREEIAETARAAQDRARELRKLLTSARAKHG